MIVSNATLAALRVNFSALFQSAYSVAPSFYDQLATTIPQTTGVGVHGFASRAPKMRKWVGERQPANLKEYSAVIVSDNYEASLEIDRNDLEDDNLGDIRPKIEELALQAKNHPNQLLKTAIQAGTATAGFDGANFFSNAHPISGTNQSNNFTSTALSVANYQAVRSAMMLLVGEDGEPLGVTPDTLVVPPQLENTARQILFGEMVSDGAGAGVTNVLRNTAKLLVVPGLGLGSGSPGTTWYLADCSKPIKPFVFQQTRKPEFVPMDRSDSPQVFLNRKLMYGVDSRDAIGYGPWWLISRAIA